jgi:hypothetical protein
LQGRETGSADPGLIPSAAQQEIKSVELEIDRIEAKALYRARSATLDRFQEITLLGKLIFYDKELSVKRNETCAFCHMPETGFSGPVSALNQTTVAYPGSVRTRFSARKPQSHTYSNYAPVLHYNPQQGDLVGGNFWDMRATGLRLNSALAEQAQGPPLDPTEIGLIDPACMVYRMSLRPYRSEWRKGSGERKHSRPTGQLMQRKCEIGPPPLAMRIPRRFISARATGELHKPLSIEPAKRSRPSRARRRRLLSLRSTTTSWPGMPSLRPMKRPVTICSVAKPRTATNAIETEDRARSRSSQTLQPPTWACLLTPTSLSTEKAPLTNSATRPTRMGPNTLIEEWAASCPAR